MESLDEMAGLVLSSVLTAMVGVLGIMMLGAVQGATEIAVAEKAAQHAIQAIVLLVAAPTTVIGMLGILMKAFSSSGGPTRKPA